MLGATPATRGANGARWQDAECFIRPMARVGEDEGEGEGEGDGEGEGPGGGDNVEGEDENDGGEQEADSNDTWLVMGTPPFLVDWKSKQPGDILLQFRPYSSPATIVLNAMEAGSWGTEEIVPLDSQAEGEWTVRVDDDGFHVLAGEGKEQGACGDGFFQQHGDVPGFGMVGESGGGQAVTECSECRELCASTSGCLSYECSPSELKCNLNSRNSPEEGSSDNLDYAFCSKHELHVFAHRLPWASFSHVEKSGECVVTEEPPMVDASGHRWQNCAALGGLKVRAVPGARGNNNNINDKNDISS